MWNVLLTSCQELASLPDHTKLLRTMSKCRKWGICGHIDRRCSTNRGSFTSDNVPRLKFQWCCASFRSPFYVSRGRVPHFVDRFLSPCGMIDAHTFVSFSAFSQDWLQYPRFADIYLSFCLAVDMVFLESFVAEMGFAKLFLS